MGKTSNSTQDLHAAARAGDLVAVQTICSSNPLSVNSRDKHTRTPLHLAAWAGHTQVVNLLCKNKADVGAAAMDDMGAIHFAAQKGHLEVVRTLVSSGVSIKSTNRKGMTPLHYAVQGSYLDLIKYLVKKGANTTMKNKAGKSPLDLATSDEIRALLSCPSGLKETDENGTESKTKEGEETDKNGTELKTEEGEETDKNGTEMKTEEGELEAVSEGETETETLQNEDGEGKDGFGKRKAENGEGMVGSKKTRVALHHLQTSDDTQEEAED